MTAELLQGCRVCLCSGCWHNRDLLGEEITQLAAFSKPVCELLYNRCGEVLNIILELLHISLLCHTLPPVKEPWLFGMSNQVPTDPGGTLQLRVPRCLCWCRAAGGAEQRHGFINHVGSAGKGALLSHLVSDKAICKPRHLQSVVCAFFPIWPRPVKDGKSCSWPRRCCCSLSPVPLWPY